MRKQMFKKAAAIMMTAAMMSTGCNSTERKWFP